jgi:cytochrome c biogenesis protein CcdA
VSGIDIAFGFLAGVVSCVTPESLLLLPLLLAAAGGPNQARAVALAVGVGLSLILSGPLAGFFGLIGVDARKIGCAVLLLLGIVLMSASKVARFDALTGGLPGGPEATRTETFRSMLRLALLGILLGANWVPVPGPVLGKASLMAADVWHSGVGLAVLFAFGVGAALPWIVMGRVVRIVSRPFLERAPRGAAGQRCLGLSLLAVAILGGTGLDGVMSHWLGGMLPAWARKLASIF